MLLKKIFTNNKSRLKRILNIPHKVNTRDRVILENIIIPFYLARKKNQRLLFVGCAPYTEHYKEYFKDHEYWTIDPDPSQKSFGSKNKHYVIPLEEIENYFKEDFFDLIICNGVFGYGLNKPDQCEKAFDNCFSCLRENGSLILGWNDVPQYKPLDLESLESLRKFKKQKQSPFETEELKTQGFANHTFNFYQKQLA